MRCWALMRLPVASWVNTSPRTALPCAVPLAHRPERGPGADVGPAGVERDHAGSRLRLRGVGLHDGVVDGVARAGAEGLDAGAEEVEVARPCRVRPLAGVEDVGAVLADQFQPALRPQHEDPAVPQVRAALEVLARGRLVGLLDERRKPEGVAQGLTLAQVAEPGRGHVGHDAEGHHRTLAGQPIAQGGGGPEGRGVGDHVVRRHRDQHRITTVGGGGQSRERQCRSSIAADRLEDDRSRVAALGRQLVDHQEAVLLVADHDRRGDRDRLPRLAVGEAVQTAHGRLQKRAVADQWKKLLGVGLARQRPQTGPGAAGQDHGLEVHGWRTAERSGTEAARRITASGARRRQGAQAGGLTQTLRFVYKNAVNFGTCPAPHGPWSQAPFLANRSRGSALTAPA